MILQQLKNKLSYILFVGLLLGLTSCVETYDEDNGQEYVGYWVGSWTCNEIDGDFAPQTYNVQVVESNGNQTVFIKGLYNQGVNFKVTGVVNGTALDINEQTVEGFYIQGSGYLINDYNQAEFEFIVNDGSGDDVVKAQWYR